MKYNYPYLIFFIFIPTQVVIAKQIDENITALPSIELKSKTTSINKIAGDNIVHEKELLEGATSIGNALNGQPGVYSAQYTGNVSRPVMRGLDGTRVKITENGSDALDVSSLSPDHAVTVDPNSAQEVQILKGPEALLYGAGSIGGLINVVDNKIPTQMPENGYQGRVGTRYNTGSDDMLYSGNATIGLGSQVALRVGGLTRNANNYILPQDLQNPDRRQDNTFAKSHNYNAGISWIYDRGFTGISYNDRHDSYGTPSDNDAYSACELNNNKTGFTSTSCGHADDDVTDDNSISWINLKEKRYSLKTELNNPFKGFSKLAAQATHTDYQHQEMDGDTPDTTYKSKGIDTRITLDNESWLGWTGQIGGQYLQQKLITGGNEALMDPTNTKRYSLFILQQKYWNQLHFQVSSRIDHQNIGIQNGSINPNAKDFKGSAYSIASSTDWEFIPNYKISLTASHQERLPTAQELYSNGKDMAYNTYALGSNNLKTEKSNNVELGLHFKNESLDYNISIFNNWFNNFIYGNILDRYQDFKLIKYTQFQANFFGAETDINYTISPQYTAGLFGDYVRGKINDEGNAPRVPGGRLGTRIHANFDENYTGSMEYYHVFKQDDIAHYETNGKSYNMLNLSFSYQKSLSSNLNYKLYTKINNLLDSKVYQHESFLSNVPQIGRNFTVGIDFNF